MAQVVELARMLNWISYHTYRSKRSPSGIPDLVLVRDRVVFAELKSEGGKPTADQRMAQGAGGRRCGGLRLAAGRPGPRRANPRPAQHERG